MTRTFATDTCRSLTALSAIALSCALWFSSCGQSLFASLDEKSPVDQIMGHLENDEPDKALAIIDKELEKSPDDEKLKSIKSAAIAQKYGVDTMSLALEVIKQQKEGAATGSTNAVTTLLAVLPPVTDAAIGGVDQAVAILDGLNNPTHSDNFKLTMLNMALLTMRLKQIDGDGTGTFTAEEIQNLTPDQAAAILNSLGGAINAANVAAQAGVSTEVAAKAIKEVQDQIQAEPGADQDAKLRSFLEKLSASNAGST